MTTRTTLPAIFSPFSSSFSIFPPITSSLHYSPNFSPKLNPRLRICQKAGISWKQRNWVTSCCSVNAGINPDDSSKESSINVQLPRRSLLVQFTCDACGERTKRLINRLAYERGTVFVQKIVNCNCLPCFISVQGVSSITN